MHDASVLPSPSYCRRALVQRCITLYPQTVSGVYSARAGLKPKPSTSSSTTKPASKSDGKLAADLADDKWRFDELPALIQSRVRDKADVLGKAVLKDEEAGTASADDANDLRGLGLTMEEVERLVRWKITHGQHRPFLPGMVRKNAASHVFRVTREAHAHIQKYRNHDNESKTNLKAKSNGNSTSSPTPLLKSVIQQALKTLTNNLHGIGPATASLILSVMEPVEVPFMQDEMTGWILEAATKGGKLKYDMKEYVSLLEGVERLMARLNDEGDCDSGRDSSGGKNITAVDLEKTAYVLSHIAVLDEEDKSELTTLVAGRHSQDALDINDAAAAPDTNAHADTDVDVDGKEAEGKGKSKGKVKDKSENESGKQTAKKSNSKTKESVSADAKRKGPSAEDTTTTTTAATSSSLPDRVKKQGKGGEGPRRSKRVKT